MPCTRRLVPCLMAIVALTPFSDAGAAKRHLEVADLARLQAVASPACSADGQWVAYTVTTADAEDDTQRTAIWMVNWAGTEHVQATEALPSAGTPRFSPDGHFLSFLGSRGADEKDQLYVIDRRGGEARRLTHVEGDITDYAWSPDGKSVALVIEGSVDRPAGTRAGAAAPKPIVIDTWRFKDDRRGYVTAADRSRIYLLDVATGAVRPLATDGHFDEATPAWSPDGQSLAFTSDHGPDPDDPGTTVLYVVDPKGSGAPRRVAHYYQPNRLRVLWTPDGRRLLYTVGLEPRLDAYKYDQLAVVDVASGKSAPLAPSLQRQVSAPVMAANGESVAVLIEDDGSQVPATIRLANGRVERRVSGKLSATAQCGGGGHLAVLASGDYETAEVNALEGTRLRRLTGHNDELLGELELGSVEDISFKSADGTEIHGMVVKPPGYEPGRRYPAILWIHGGPVGQDEHALAFEGYSPEFERQWFAAHGYVAIAINYRGGSGRGPALQQAIVADWGRLEVEDLLAGVAYTVATGLADPARLGIGGWSYGGILTDYTIASDSRFRAAVSGAGSGNQISMLGTDEYVLAYSHELGMPWQHADTWLKVSYPFFHADRIRTPTLFMGGDRDFNVPIAGSEQMYQLLKVQGVPTELVVYPGQHHVFDRPSFYRDKMVRFIDWFDRYLKPAP